jgi:hypothetical protein
MFEPLKNPSTAAIRALAGKSKHDACRRICDPRSGDFWYWPFEQATHAEGASVLGVPYDRKPGEGDVIFI